MVDCICSCQNDAFQGLPVLAFCRRDLTLQGPLRQGSVETPASCPQAASPPPAPHPFAGERAGERAGQRQANKHSASRLLAVMLQLVGCDDGLLRAKAEMEERDLPRQGPR